jgi:hypothetical protein
VGGETVQPARTWRRDEVCNPYRTFLDHPRDPRSAPHLGRSHNTPWPRSCDWCCAAVLSSTAQAGEGGSYGVAEYDQESSGERGRKGTSCKVLRRAGSARGINIETVLQAQGCGGRRSAHKSAALCARHSLSGLSVSAMNFQLHASFFLSRTRKRKNAESPRRSVRAPAPRSPCVIGRPPPALGACRRKARRGDFGGAFTPRRTEFVDPEAIVCVGIFHFGFLRQAPSGVHHFRRIYAAAVLPALPTAVAGLVPFHASAGLELRRTPSCPRRSQGSARCGSSPPPPAKTF